MKQAPTPLHVVAQDGGNVVATCGPLLITLIGDELTLPYVEAASVAGRDLFAEHPGGTVSLTLLTNQIPMPNDATRKAAKESTIRSDKWIRAAATVLIGEGFWNAAARGLLSSLEYFSHRGPQRRVFGDLTSAMQWLDEHCELGPEVVSVVEPWAKQALVSARD